MYRFVLVLVLVSPCMGLDVRAHFGDLAKKVNGLGIDDNLGKFFTPRARGTPNVARFDVPSEAFATQPNLPLLYGLFGPDVTPGVTTSVDMHAWVYLPPGYDPMDTEVHYPTIYMLHGFHSSAENVQDSLIFPTTVGVNTLIESHLLPPVILVFPQGFRWGDAYPIPPAWTNSLIDGTAPFGGGQKGPWTTFILDELVPWVDATFKTKARRSQRALMGHSGGGIGSLEIASDPRASPLFGQIVSMSGLMDLMPYLDPQTEREALLFFSILLESCPSCTCPTCNPADPRYCEGDVSTCCPNLDTNPLCVSPDPTENCPVNPSPNMADPRPIMCPLDLDFTPATTLRFYFTSIVAEFMFSESGSDPFFGLDMPSMIMDHAGFPVMDGLARIDAGLPGQIFPFKPHTKSFRLWLDVGDKDEFLFESSVIRLDEKLQAQGWVNDGNGYQFEVYDGRHSDKVEERFGLVFPWLFQGFAAAADPPMECADCQNGGYCDESTGACVCPEEVWTGFDCSVPVTPCSCTRPACEFREVMIEDAPVLFCEYA